MCPDFLELSYAAIIKDVFIFTTEARAEAQRRKPPDPQNSRSAAAQAALSS
jgi:hypothetical protein